MLKLSKVEIIKVNIPRNGSFEISRGSFRTASRVLVRATLQDGSVGYGECSPLVGTSDHGAVAIWSEETQSSCYTMIEEQIAPALIGADVTNMAAVHATMATTTLMNPMAKAGIDIALHDALGKALGMPVHSLLGGAYRDKIPLAQSVGVRTDDEVLAGAKKIVDDGFQVIKLKGGRDINADVKRIELIRKAVGDFPIRLDANAGYPAYDQIILGLMRAQDLGLNELEQPLGRFDLRGMSRIARELHTPLLADESVFYAHDAANCIAMEACDVINIKVQKAGGLFPAIRIDHVAQGSKVGVLVGAVQESGIGTSASLHLASACKTMSCASDCRTHLVLENTLLRSTLKVADGFADVPQGPGLGIEVDEDAIAKYASGSWKSVGPDA
ncbi:MAG: mandelate racemase/muconate lactonizing enzyme family protein [Hyphomicrobiales bacterium]|nr:mandelate racemase/muconate lactonizing enzyme family protein [Hyphomicrobiales bacterium]